MKGGMKCPWDVKNIASLSGDEYTPKAETEATLKFPAVKLGQLGQDSGVFQLND